MSYTDMPYQPTGEVSVRSCQNAVKNHCRRNTFVNETSPKKVQIVVKAKGHKANDALVSGRLMSRSNKSIWNQNKTLNLLHFSKLDPEAKGEFGDKVIALMTCLNIILAGMAVF